MKQKTNLTERIVEIFSRLNTHELLKKSRLVRELKDEGYSINAEGLKGILKELVDTRIVEFKGYADFGKDEIYSRWVKPKVRAEPKVYPTQVAE